MAIHLKEATQQSSGFQAAPHVRSAVTEIIDRIRQDGDSAVREYSKKFDMWDPAEFKLSVSQIEEIVANVPQQVLDDIRTVQANVRAFAEHQLRTISDVEVETMPGVFLGQKNIPVARVGAYVPGGRYPLLASAHMTIVTARVAGVDSIIAATPPIRGEIPAATVAAMHLAGADEIYLLGGVQAVTAFSVGTETIDPVDVLVGPGNAYVAEAKRQLYGEIGIDLLAGPTEVLIIADETANPFVVAVDLLSQAEHGPDSPAILVTTSEDLGREVMRLIDELLPGMPTADLAGPAWENYGEVIVADDMAEAWKIGDDIASEHVQVLTVSPRDALTEMRNYGALFLGEGTCVSYGDKVIGTNHTLPTKRTARYTGGLWVGKFLKTVTYQEVSNKESSAQLGELCGRASRAEQFEGHARSGDIRAWLYGDADLDWASDDLKVKS